MILFCLFIATVASDLFMFYVQILELLMHGYLHTIAGENEKASRKLEKKRSNQVKCKVLRNGVEELESDDKKG